MTLEGEAPDERAGIGIDDESKRTEVHDPEVVKHMNARYMKECCPFCDSCIDEFGYCARGAGRD